MNAVNWLQITKDNWPIKGTDGSPFYVLHSEFNTGVLFSLNASFFKDISLVSTAQLGFKVQLTGCKFKAVNEGLLSLSPSLAPLVCNGI